MDIIRMTGGMGNQMFQYALYLKLSSMGREVKLDDITEYNMENSRPVMLWAFGIDYPKATRKEINQITDGFLRLSHRIRRKLFGRKSLEYHEKDCNFDPQVLEKSPAYLTGYFQSEKYFEDIRKEVLNAFVFRPVIYDGLNDELKNKILSCLEAEKHTLAVSLHIRRGDYLANNEVYGGICTEEYYLKAISVMRELYPGATFYVFSNDSDYTDSWLLETFPGSIGEIPERAAESGCEWARLEGKFVPVKGVPEEMGYLDMMLMSRCRHHIIANSSFSWWGAYLNNSKDKTVIAPASWFNNQDCRDIYTKEMIRISAKGSIEEYGRE